MQFDFDPIPRRRQSQYMRGSIGLEQMINQLDKKSDSKAGNGSSQMVDFDNFDNIQQSQSFTKSFTSEFFNQPKQEQPSFPQSKQPPKIQQSHDTSRDIAQISYLNYSQDNESFKFQRSMSFEQEGEGGSSNLVNPRFQKLKRLLNNAKKDNNEDFYKILDRDMQQAKQTGNLQFKTKAEFKDYARNMKYQKREKQIQFEKEKVSSPKKGQLQNKKTSLFGSEAADAFKKKNAMNFNILPAEYTTEQDDDQYGNFQVDNVNNLGQNQDEGFDFFASKKSDNPYQKKNGASSGFSSSLQGFNHESQIKNNPSKQSNAKQHFIEQGQQFFDSLNKQYGSNPSHNPASNLNTDQKSSNLQIIRQQKQTVLDHSLQERRLQDLMQNYTNMKNNYTSLMSQLQQTSNGQQRIMQQMQRIKAEHIAKKNKNKEQHNNNKLQQNGIIADKKAIKQQQQQQQALHQQNREQFKKVKTQQLQSIKNQILQIRHSQNKDAAYLQINDKIEGLENIVRNALKEVQQQKQKNSSNLQKTSSRQPNVINYFNDKDVDAVGQAYSGQGYGQGGSTSQRMYDVQGQADDDEKYKQAQCPVNDDNMYHKNPKQSQQQSPSKLKSQSSPHSRHNHNPNKVSNSEINHKHHSHYNHHHNAYSPNHHQQHHGPYTSQGASRVVPNDYRSHARTASHHLNNRYNVDDLSSPFQLDFSMQDKDSHGVVDQAQFQIGNFNPPEFALEYLPLMLDQTDGKNLRSILTQKSSILYESFEFLITCRYTMQPDDHAYPMSAELRVSNKCAIDLLDVFVIVYGVHGQNVEVSPNKIFEDRLRFNSNLFFTAKIDKQCIQDNGFHIQVCYKTDSITKKKINFKALLPVAQMIRPQFCYEQNFIDSWQSFQNQIYIRPRKLDFKHIRSHEDLKLILPLIDINECDPNVFTYGLMFQYPKSSIIFMLKICCYLNGKASIHMRSDKSGDQKLKEELLNIFAFLFFV